MLIFTGGNFFNDIYIWKITFAYFSDLMDALSDPRAFLSAQEKREQQMAAMGIEAADINTKDLKGGKSGGAAATTAGSKSASTAGPAAAKKEEAKRKVLGCIIKLFWGRHFNYRVVGAFCITFSFHSGSNQPPFLNLLSSAFRNLLACLINWMGICVDRLLV